MNARPWSGTPDRGRERQNRLGAAGVPLPVRGLEGPEVTTATDRQVVQRLWGECTVVRIDLGHTDRFVRAGGALSREAGGGRVVRYASVTRWAAPAPTATTLASWRSDRWWRRWCASSCGRDHEHRCPGSNDRGLCGARHRQRGWPAIPLLLLARANPRALGHRPAAPPEREHEVLQLVVRGMSNDQIATELNISRFTVKNHVSSILAKFDVNSRTEAIRVAIQEKIVLLD